MNVCIILAWRICRSTHGADPLSGLAVGVRPPPDSLSVVAKSASSSKDSISVRFGASSKAASCLEWYCLARNCCRYRFSISHAQAVLVPTSVKNAWRPNIIEISAPASCLVLLLLWNCLKQVSVLQRYILQGSQRPGVFKLCWRRAGATPLTISPSISVAFPSSDFVLRSLH
jgi:hypothetical protein